MKYFSLLLVTFFIVCSISVSSQNIFIQFSGHVRDQVTQQPVVNHMVLLTLDTTDSYTYSDIAFTDEMGWYSFPASVPRIPDSTNYISIRTLDCTNEWKGYFTLNYEGGLAGSETDLLICTDPANIPGPCENRIIAERQPGNNVIFYGGLYSGAQATCLWDFGDGTTGSGSPAEHLYVQQGIYNVVLQTITADSCIDTSIYFLQVADSLNPSPCKNTISIFREGGPLDVTFVGNLPGAQQGSYYWDFGDGTTASEKIVTHTYAQTGFYNVMLKTSTSDSCVDYSGFPLALMDSLNQTECANFILPVEIEDLTVSLHGYLYNGLPASYIWNFGDGTSDTAQYVAHTYTQPGNYSISLQTLTVDSCMAYSDINIGLIDSVSQGCNSYYTSETGNSSFEIHFNGFTDSSFPTEYLFDFGDPASGVNNTSNLQNTLHTFSAPGIYNVTLHTTDSTGCSFVYMNQVTVTDSMPNGCDSHFTALAGNNLNEIQFNGFTVSQFPTAWLWNFGDPASGTNNTSTLQNPIHTFSSAGTYLVTLTTTDSVNCGSTFSAPLILSMYTQFSLYGQVFAQNQSITDCKVQLFSQDYAGNMNLIRVTIPDSANYYKFDTVSSGIYHILAIPDQGTLYAQLYLPTYFGDAFLWENSTPVVLGQPTNPYHIHLADFDSISGGDGIITGGLTTGGKSIDVGNQEILILDNANIPVKYMFSQADGSFSFSGLPYGEYKVYPVITGIRTYPVTVILSETNKSATVIMKISGQSVAGKSDMELSNLIENIYPNPASDLISITVKGKGEIKIQIVDVSGKIVLIRNENIREQGELISLPVDELLKGLYLMIIHDEKGNTSSRRFIKN